MFDAVYEDRGETVHAGELARGPWSPDAQHGGPPAALLMRAFERLDDGGADLQLARVTYELMRPVPLGELRLRAEVVRPGRRVQLLEGSIFTPDGTEVVRARALRVARAPVSAGEPGAAVPAGPHGIPRASVTRFGVDSYPGGALEIRMSRGDFTEVGPAAAWFRLRVPLVAGEQPTPLQRLAAAADFPNGIASELPWSDWIFINPDLTLYIERAPVGEWICLDAQMRVVEGGIGLSQAVLFDTRGRVGRSLQSLYVARTAA
jgi:hypothetical protein